MRIGILGLAQSGKRTLFRLLTGAEPPPHRGKGAFPLGIGPIPDSRLDGLSALFNPKKTKYAEIEWILFPALPPDEAARREWFDQVRELDGLCYVIREFSDPSVYHEDGSVDPARDVSKLDLELSFADLMLIETRLERLAGDTAKKTAAERKKQVDVLSRMKAVIEEENPLRTLELDAAEIARLEGLKFLNRKECMLVLNVDEAHAADEERLRKLASGLPAQGREMICLSAKIETELAEIDDERERAEFLEALGLSESGAAKMAKAALRTLGLISFFTVGPDEVRAWLTRRDSVASEAAGKIHTDFKRGFIRAEIMRPEELLVAGSEAKLREQGKLFLKGKDYVVREGDIVHILANA